jgi:hypothetical protein
MLASDASRLALPSNFADRVYCISVLEHIQSAYQRVQAVQEIHRILKPGGLAAITIDVHFQHEIVNPLSLAWHSGMDLEGTTSLCLPKDRFTFFKEVVPPQSCDVFGLLLRKPYGPVTYGSPAVELSPLQLSIWRYTNSEEEKRRFYVAQNLHNQALNGSLRAAFKLILLGVKDALRGLRYRVATTRKLER